MDRGLKIKINQLVAITVNVAALIMVIAIQNLTRTLWGSISLGIYVVIFIYNTLTLYKIKRKWNSFVVVMYALICLFHLSQIYFCVINYEDYYCIFSRMNFDVCQDAFTFAYVCIHVMMIFFFISYKNNNSSRDFISSCVMKKTDQSLIKILFCFFFVLKILVRLYWMYVGIKLGYLALLSAMSSLTSTIVMVSDVFSIVFLNNCCTYRDKKKFIVIFIIIEVVFMASGSRILGITYILLLLIFVLFSQNKNGKRLSLNYKILIAIAGVALVLIVPAISENRFSSGSIFSLDYVKNSNVINSILKEFGMTILNLVVEISNKTKIEFYHGLSYYGGIVSLVPNIGGFYDSINDKLFYVNQLKDLFYYSYGGSNIAEAYINFGYLGFLIFIPAGVIIAKIEEILGKIKFESAASQLFIVTLVYEMILWNRSYFFQMLRLPVWVCLAYYIIRNLIGKKG